MFYVFERFLWIGGDVPYFIHFFHIKGTNITPHNPAFSNGRLNSAGCCGVMFWFLRVNEESADFVVSVKNSLGDHAPIHFRESCKSRSTCTVPMEQGFGLISDRRMGVCQASFNFNGCEFSGDVVPDAAVFDGSGDERLNSASRGIGINAIEQVWVAPCFDAAAGIVQFRRGLPLSKLLNKSRQLVTDHRLEGSSASWGGCIDRQG